jgi:hypothetical protein
MVGAASLRGTAPVRRSGRDEVRRALRSLAAIALLGLCLFAASPARAADPPPTPPAAPAPEAEDPDIAAAKSLFYKGVSLMNAGDDEHALDRFLRSRALFPGAKNTKNAAICLEHLGRFDEALELYEELLTKHVDALDPGDQTALQALIPALRSKVASVEIVSNVSAPVSIDGRLRGKLPLAGPIRVLPGPHVLRVELEGYLPFQGPIEATAGGRLLVDATLQPVPRPTPVVAARKPPSPKASGGAPMWAWASGGAGLALLGVAAGFGLDGLAAQRSLDDHCDADLTCPGYDPTDENARKNRGLVVFISAGAVGLAGVGVGVAGLTTGAGDEEAAGQWLLRPALAERGGGLSAQTMW